MKYRYFSLFPIFLVASFAPKMALAQDVTTSAEALTIALTQAGLDLSDEIKIESMEAVRFRNGHMEWSFELRDGENVHDVTVEQNRDQKVRSDEDSRNANAEFWALLPAPADVETVESYVERARAELVEVNPELMPRDQYIVEYDVCDPPRDGGREYASGCRYDVPRETWTIILRSDVRGTDDWVNKAITFEDGRRTEITGARVGGNW